MKSNKELSEEEVEVIARAIHEVWMEAKIKDGWQYSPVTNKREKKHNCLVIYDNLSEEDKQSDRDIAKKIISILEKNNFQVIKKKK